MELIICPLSELNAGLARQPARVLSLLSPGTPAPVCPGIAPPCHLVLEFHDIISPQAGLRAVQPADIAAIIAFAQGWDGTAPLLVHCWAGISRSTAAAYIIVCLLGADEHAAAQALRAAAPQATPNARMIALADAQLGCAGRMVGAITAIGRGAEAAQGELFSLAVSTGPAARRIPHSTGRSRHARAAPCPADDSPLNNA